MTETLNQGRETELELDALARDYLESQAERSEEDRIGTYVLAEKSIADVLEVSHRSSSVHELVLCLLEDGRIEDAFTIVKGLIMANPENSRFQTLLASLHLSEGRFEEAMAAYSYALVLDSGDIDALVQRGEAYLARGLYELARQDFRKALRLGAPDTERVNRLLKMTARRRRSAGRESAIDTAARARLG